MEFLRKVWGSGDAQMYNNGKSDKISKLKKGIGKPSFLQLVKNSNENHRVEEYLNDWNASSLTRTHTTHTHTLTHTHTVSSASWGVATESHNDSVSFAAGNRARESSLKIFKSTALRQHASPPPSLSSLFVSCGLRTSVASIRAIAGAMPNPSTARGKTWNNTLL